MTSVQTQWYLPPQPLETLVRPPVIGQEKIKSSHDFSIRSSDMSSPDQGGNKPPLPPKPSKQPPPPEESVMMMQPADEKFQSPKLSEKAKALEASPPNTGSETSRSFQPEGNVF